MIRMLCLSVKLHVPLCTLVVNAYIGVNLTKLSWVLLKKLIVSQLVKFLSFHGN
jgi:type III secretory pathway component EscV